MLNFRRIKDPKTGEERVETSVVGKPLLTTPQLNKGTAFSQQERQDFGLYGKLPSTVESIEQQLQRAYIQFTTHHHKLKKNIYLNELHDSNQVLFYKLVSEHLTEMLPVIYTPIVGKAVKKFSQEYRTPRGLYISTPDEEHIEELLDNRSNPDIDLIVVTDGEGVLGIGDQGIGGMDIPIAKLMVYTLCGGIDPNRTLPILLDVGTNNQELLDDPLYLGWRHNRLTGKDYDNFVDRFVQAVKKKFPNVFLHWEDFGRENARRNLERYQSQICTFNDDMQGTGVVTLSAILAAVRACKSSMKNQRVVVFGAGTAGTGIADQICDAMVHCGLSREEARKRFWLIDRPGLLFEDTSDLNEFQKIYARQQTETSDWEMEDPSYVSLTDVVKNVKPTILIGCSAVPGAFTKEIIQHMAAHTERPIILPLSNPTERCEAQPLDLYNWTNGKVLIATGSPFDAIEYDHKSYVIAQCNNALVFPGLGLGLLAVKAKQVSDKALWTACQVLSDFSPLREDPYAPLLPDLENVRDVSYHIAVAVAKQVIEEGAAQVELGSDLEKTIKEMMWQPKYLPFTKITE